jgi:hypothetical protein
MSTQISHNLGIRSINWARIFDLIEEAAEVADRLGSGSGTAVTAPTNAEPEKANSEGTTDAK